MTVRVYQSTDASAPSLTGLAGALITVLDACLVNGYGSKAAAGWAKSYSGTNKAVYRPSAGNRHYLRVDDSGGQWARVRGYETMSDVDTGTGLMPTEAQISGGGYLNKGTNNSTVRGWILVADEKRFWLVMAVANTTIADSTGAGYVMFFGDLVPFKSGDAHHTMLIASISTSTGADPTGSLATALGTVTGGHFLMRSYTQSGTCVTASKHSDAAKKTAATMGNNGSAYPDPVTGGILIAPLYANEAVALVVRGRIPGMWDVLHNLPATPGDTFSGNGDLAGKTFVLVDMNTGGVRCRGALEISDTWE